MKTSISKPGKVIVAMSGGVDSSVAAFLLREQGWETIGVTMDIGYGHAPEQAAAACAQLGIAHYVVDMRSRFQERVVDGFIDAYMRGETPNPCVNCNVSLKFPAFLSLFEQLSADAFATGHYVKIIEQNGRYLLYCGDDKSKDQSYFLYRLDQDLLRRCIFTLGDLSKTQVREIAEKAGLLSAGQKDSYDVCFLPGGDYRRLIRERAGKLMRTGDMVDRGGKVVGQHKGLANYTVGQRHGLDVAFGYPAYVLELDIENNRVVVGEKAALFAEEAYTRDNHFLPFEDLKSPLAVEVRIRYRSSPKRALLEPVPNRPDLLHIHFLEPVWGVTPGQSAVFYQGDLLIGGGILQKSNL